MQRDTTVSIWGTSKPNNLITVSASWGFNSSTSSDSLGNWKTSIRTVEEEGPFSLVITSGKDRINIKVNYLLEDRFINAIKQLIKSLDIKDSFLLSTLLKIPGLSELESLFIKVDPITIY